MPPVKATTPSVPWLDEYKRLIAGSFLVFVAFLFPLVWLNTTAVYRAPLPYLTIGTWDVESINAFYSVKVVIHLSPAWRSAEEVGAKTVQEQIQESIDLTMESLLKNWTRPVAQFLIRTQVEWWPEAKASSHGDWEKLMNGFQERVNLEDPSYHLYVVPIHEKEVLKSQSLGSVGKYRNMLLRLTEFVMLMSDLITTLFMDELTMIADGIDSSMANTQANDVFHTRATHYTPHYQVSLSLINGASATTEVDWSIEEAVQAFWVPLFEQLQLVATFRLSSQNQRFAESSIQPKFHSDYLRHEISSSLIPNVINYAEWNLATSISNDPEFNFIIYVPPRQQQPLVIMGENNKPTPLNAFLVPRWGGLVILNPGMSNATKYNNVDHVVLGVPHLQPVMEVFLAQFRSLLGIASIWSEERPLHKLIESAYNFKMFISSSPVALSSWDMDRLLRRRTIENIVNTAKTLNSLRRLLTNLQNIVVQDHIQSKVKDALFYLQEAYSHVKPHEDPKNAPVSKIQDLISAFSASKLAIRLAEEAFFDPSMTSMLYFPLEHQYAIYAPLFFPMIVPILISLVRSIQARVRAGKSKPTTLKQR